MIMMNLYSSNPVDLEENPTFGQEKKMDILHFPTESSTFNNLGKEAFKDLWDLCQTTKF